jgi:hypothetical protein
MFLFQCERSSFTPIQNNRQNYSTEITFLNKTNGLVLSWRTCSVWCRIKVFIDYLFLTSGSKRITSPSYWRGVLDTCI